MGYTRCIQDIKAAKSIIAVTNLRNCPEMWNLRSKRKANMKDLTTQKQPVQWQRTKSNRCRHEQDVLRPLGEQETRRQSNGFSKSSLFLPLITLHLCFSHDIKTNPSWLTWGEVGALQFSLRSCNSGEDPPSDIIWISNSNLPLINTSMNVSASGQIQ